MVFEEVWVFVEVDRLEREFAQPLAPVGVGCGLGGDAAAAEFATGSILVTLVRFMGRCIVRFYLVIHSIGGLGG